jgi:hypothetical protein
MELRSPSMANQPQASNATSVAIQIAHVKVLFEIIPIKAIDHW